MQHRSFGPTDLSLSELGFGCAAYWAKPYFSEKTALQLIEQAVDGGMRVFDTGSSYGDGLAELRLGKALAAMPSSARDKLIISTKAGSRRNHEGKLHKDFSANWIQQSVEESFKRLRVDHIDILHLHGPKVRHLHDLPIETLLRFKEQGKVRCVSINSFDDPVLEAAVEMEWLDGVMLDYNLLRRDREPLIERLYAAKKGVMAGAALANRVFANPLTRIRKPQDVWYLLRTLRHHRAAYNKAKNLRWMENVQGMTAGQIALSYVLQNSHISCAFFGTTRLQHLQENMAATSLLLSKDIIARL